MQLWEKIHKLQPVFVRTEMTQTGDATVTVFPPSFSLSWTWLRTAAHRWDSPSLGLKHRTQGSGFSWMLSFSMESAKPLCPNSWNLQLCLLIRTMGLHCLGHWQRDIILAVMGGLGQPPHMSNSDREPFPAEAIPTGKWISSRMHRMNEQWRGDMAIFAMKPWAKVAPKSCVLHRGKDARKPSLP